MGYRSQYEGPAGRATLKQVRLSWLADDAGVVAAAG
jgi:hypothetical protein